MVGNHCKCPHLQLHVVCGGKVERGVFDGVGSLAWHDATEEKASITLLVSVSLKG